MTLKISVIVQARMASTRLPGKVLLPLEGKPVLWHIVNRLKFCKNVDRVVIATSTNPKDDAIEEFAKKENIPFLRGSENDLLDRLHQTCLKFDIETFIRVTGDCPLVDPKLVDEMIDFYFQNKDKCDLLSNVHPPTFPDGLDLEIIPAEILKELDAKLENVFDRENFTVYLFNKTDYKQMNYSNEKDISSLRWTLDTPEDYEFFKIIFRKLFSYDKVFLKEHILKLLTERPEISKINDSFERDYKYYQDLEDQQNKNKKIMVVGCGSIGQRHIKNLSSFFKGKIIACDNYPLSLDKIKNNFPSVICYQDLDEAIKKENPQQVIIATPNHLHIVLAKKVLDSAKSILIEKPLSHNLENVDQFLKEAEDKKVDVFVGFNTRFNPLVKRVREMVNEGKLGKIISIKINFGSHLPSRHPDTDYRKEYITKSHLGGGIILDMVHELDYLLWIFGYPKEVFSFAEKRSSLEMETEDSTDILIKFSNTLVANLHFDFIRRPYTRTIEIVGEEGLIMADFAKNGDCNQLEVVTYNHTSNNKESYIFSLNSDETYINELKYFTSECQSGEILPSGKEAKQVLSIALAIKESAKEGKIIPL